MSATVQHLAIGQAVFRRGFVAGQRIGQKSHIACTERVGILEEWANASTGAIDVSR